MTSLDSIEPHPSLHTELEIIRQKKYVMRLQQEFLDKGRVELWSTNKQSLAISYSL